MKQRRKDYSFKRTLAAALALFCLTASAASAQDTLQPVHKGFLLSCWRDGRDIALFPTSLRKSDAWFIAAGAALTGMSFLADPEIYQKWSLKKPAPRTSEWIRYSLTPWGNGIYPVVVSLLLYSSGSKQDQQWLALYQLKTVGVAALASRVPKLLLQRHRPGDDTPPESWKWEGPLGGVSGFNAFPSGHSFIAFAWASATVAATPGRHALHAGLYGIAALTSASRVYTGKHWLSDAVGGAVMGYALGRLMYRLQEKNWKRRPSARIKP